ncbi:MAG: BlaI/MecI/CopY family transcriptional regulator [Pirellulaceae bacterium]|nr:BlaI/MecI/CopY family transcriptional regulator [Pirellulaceae bacterium]
MTELERSLVELSTAQQEIMEIIWEQGELSVAELQQILSRRRKVARNTVRTLVERMEEKGWLLHRTIGRTFFYSAAIPKTVSVGQKIAEVVDKVCGGSAESMVAALLNYRGLDAKELKSIRQLLDGAQSSGGEQPAQSQRASRDPVKRNKRS